MEQKSDRRYSQFGRASLIPGLQIAIEFLEEKLDTLRLELAAAEGQASVEVKGKRGWSADPEERKKEAKRRYAKSLKNVKRKKKTKVNGWSTDPEERRKEMARRQRMWKKKSNNLVKIGKEAA